jgi:hypothetical protein
MSSTHKHSIPKQKEVDAPGGAPTPTGSNEPTGATPTPAPYDPQDVVLLSQTKNTVETIHREARDETVINGKYILDGEDDKYFYCYYQTTYRTKVLKDSAKAGINYRDEKGRLLPGFSLVKATKEVTGTQIKRTKRKYTRKTAEKYLEEELLADLVEDLQTADLSAKDKLAAKLAILNFVKPTLSKNTQENVVRIVNDEFDEAQVVDDDELNTLDGDENEVDE